MLSSSNCKSYIMRYHNYCIYSLSSNICNDNNLISKFGNQNSYSSNNISIIAIITTSVENFMIADTVYSTVFMTQTQYIP